MSLQALVASTVFEPIMRSFWLFYSVVACRLLICNTLAVRHGHIGLEKLDRDIVVARVEDELTF